LCLEAAALVWCLFLELKKNPPPWGRYRAGVLIGFGIAALATVLADVARSNLGASFESIFRYAPAVAYIYASVMWLRAFYREESPSRKTKPPHKKLLRAAMKFIDKAIEDLDKGSDWLTRLAKFKSSL
jgi:hypothetical protein